MSYNEILLQIKNLPSEEQFLLLEDLSRFLRENFTPVKSEKMTASELRRLPPEERKKILEEQARAMLEDYQPGGELTEFTLALEGEDIYEYEEK